MPSGALLRMYTPVSCRKQYPEPFQELQASAEANEGARTVEAGRWASLIGAGVDFALQVSRLGLRCASCAQEGLCDARDTQTGRPQAKLCMSEQSGKSDRGPADSDCSGNSARNWQVTLGCAHCSFEQLKPAVTRS